MTTLSLDPKRLREIADCPVCRAAGAFRPKGVMGQYWFNRCRNCGYYQHWHLPKITKKIIYLDQLFISNMVKAKQPFWSDLHKRLGSLAGFQLIVCPYSDIHNEESLLSPDLRDELKVMYRSLSGTIQFRGINEIEQDQLLAAIRRWLGTSESQAARPAWHEALESDPHAWAADLQVFADFPVHESRVTDLRNRKQALHADLRSVRDLWQDEDRKFIEDVKRETLAFGRTLIGAYRELSGGRQHLEEMMPDELKAIFRDCVGPDRFDPHTPPGVQPGIMLVHSLAAEVHKVRPEETDPVAVVDQFFQSKEAMEVPFQFIKSRLWAAIAQKVRNPKGPRQAKPSDPYDVKAIASFAPYCDAMLVDNEFREMASQKNVDVPGKFGVRIFSMKTRDDLMAYLVGLWSEMTDAHREGLALIHPHLVPVLPLIGRK
jgi:hypothetical protein